MQTPPAPRGSSTHSADVRELLGAHIVGAHHKRLVVSIQVLTQALVVLRAQRECGGGGLTRTAADGQGQRARSMTQGPTSRAAHCIFHCL